MKKQTKAIDLHARKLGDEPPLLWTPLIGRTRERVLAEATAKADMVRHHFQGPRGRAYWNYLPDPKPYQNPNLWRPATNY